MLHYNRMDNHDNHQLTFLQFVQGFFDWFRPFILNFFDDGCHDVSALNLSLAQPLSLSADVIIKNVRIESNDVVVYTNARCSTMY